MAVAVSNDGMLGVWTRKATAALPAVGRTNVASNVFLVSDYSVPAAASASQSTVVSVDAASGTVVRNAVQNFTTGVTRPETVSYNVPRAGYTRRSPGLVTQSNGAPSNVAEFVLLIVTGTDFSVLALPASNQFGLSVIVRSSP